MQKPIMFVLFTIAMFYFMWPTDAKAEQSFGLHLSGVSKHINPEADYNEKNYGAGIVYEVNNHYLAAGWYKNSFNITSKYIFVGWRHTFRTGNWMVSPGVAMGGITGYYEDKTQIAAAPVVAFGYNPVRINLMYLPGINGFDAVWFAQLEIELWSKR